MRKKETASDLSPRSVESPSLPDIVLLVDSAGIALGATQAFSPKVRGERRVPGGFATSRWVDIPLVGADGEVSGVLCKTTSRSDMFPTYRPDAVEAIEGAPQFIVHDINNLFAVIGSGLRLLESQSDATRRGAIVSRMQEAITKGAVLSRQLLDAARPRLRAIETCVDRSRLAAMARTLDGTLGPDVTVCSEVDPNLSDFDADPEELYFALLNLCRNSADAMPEGGMITVAARNVEGPADAARKYVEIVVADDGEGMPENLLSQVFVPYFTTKAPGRGTGLGLPQVQRFAERWGGTISIESELGGGTVVRLLLPCMHPAQLSGSTAVGEVTFVPTPEGGIFHVTDPTTDCS